MSESPTKEYRDQLANELFTLRKSGEVSIARQRLGQEKNTHIYQLSRVLKLDKPRERKFGTKEFDGQIEEDSQSYNTLSNEASLYEIFPYIKHAKGAGLGVGLDQMLDIAVNSALEEVFLVDLLPHVSVTSKALLEIGRRHHELFGNYPTPEEYLAYFQTDNIPSTIEMISPEFDEAEIATLNSTFRKKVRDRKSSEPESGTPNQLEYYLRFKSTQQEYRSWVSDPDALRKIVTMYEERKITPILGDLTGVISMEKIASRLTNDGRSLGLVYLSNALYYISKFGGENELWQNLEKMPLADDSIIVETSFGGLMPLPESVSSDPWMEKLMQSWNYQVQTIEDKRKQDNGEYKANIGGQDYVLSDISDRAYAVEEGADPNTLNIRVPKPGLLVAGIQN